MRVSVRTAAAAGVATLATVVLVTGVADAATGGYLVIGRSNTASTTTSLSNSAGTPLALYAPTGKPPLAVNQAVKVPRLNADLLDGLDSTLLQRRVTGTCGPLSGVRVVGSTGAVACSGLAARLLTSSATVSVPAGVTAVLVDLYGAGGGGGGAAPGASGGGSGSHERVLLTVSAGQALDVVVGAGGLGGVPVDWSTPAPGQNGGASSVAVNGGAVLAAAGGGAGGTATDCLGSATGGAAGQPGAVSAPALGLAAESGVVGGDGADNHCGPSGVTSSSGLGGGTPGFVGVGGAGGTAAPPGFTQTGGSGQAGSGGLVVLTFLGS